MGLLISRRIVLLSAARALTSATAIPIWGIQASPDAEASQFPEPSNQAESLVRTFYVSASGNDSADGLSPESAWATIDKANSSLPTDRSVIRFRQGDIFYGELSPPFGCEVGSYGEGDKPILTMFKILNRSESWTEHAQGVWKIDLGTPATHDGYNTIADANIGYLVVDRTVMPASKLSLSELSSPWDFYCNLKENTLYVTASTNPAVLAGDIKAAPNGRTGRVILCSAGSNEIHDVHVTGTGGCGIGGAAPDVHIHDCLIDYIGGSRLQDGTNNRYGNGIDNWVNVKRWLIEDNEIAQAYDVAWSPQGRAGTSGSWEDLTVRNNHIHDCNQSFEFWSRGSSSAGGFKRIVVEGNVCERAGYSVFSDVRPDQDTRVHLLTYRWDTAADITIQNNVFDDARGAYSYHFYEPVGYITRNNTIRLKAGQKMQYQRPETVEHAADWQAATGREVGSIIVID
jgi:hypothetical protein